MFQSVGRFEQLSQPQKSGVVPGELDRSVVVPVRNLHVVVERNLLNQISAVLRASEMTPVRNLSQMENSN